MFCTDEQWMHCNVEKMTCTGCFYNEEDIKILEELAEEYNSQHYMDMPLINGKQIQAIENLIKEYRELENKSKEQAKFIENIQDNMGHKGMAKTELAFVCASLEHDNKELEEDLENSIPKSKIKEKIEELEKEKSETYIKFLESDRTNANLSTKGKMLEGGIQVLQELMEDK